MDSLTDTLYADIGMMDQKMDRLVHEYIVDSFTDTLHLLIKYWRGMEEELDGSPKKEVLAKINQ